MGVRVGLSRVGLCPFLPDHPLHPGLACAVRELPGAGAPQLPALCGLFPSLKFKLGASESLFVSPLQLQVLGFPDELQLRCCMLEGS